MNDSFGMRNASGFLSVCFQYEQHGCRPARLSGTMFNEVALASRLLPMLKSRQPLRFAARGDSATDRHSPVARPKIALARTADDEVILRAQRHSCPPAATMLTRYREQPLRLASTVVGRRDFREIRRHLRGVFDGGSADDDVFQYQGATELTANSLRQAVV